MASVTRRDWMLTDSRQVDRRLFVLRHRWGCFASNGEGAFGWKRRRNAGDVWLRTMDLSNGRESVSLESDNFCDLVHLKCLWTYTVQQILGHTYRFSTAGTPKPVTKQQSVRITLFQKEPTCQNEYYRQNEYPESSRQNTSKSHQTPKSTPTIARSPAFHPYPPQSPPQL